MLRATIKDLEWKKGISAKNEAQGRREGSDAYFWRVLPNLLWYNCMCHHKILVAPL